MQHDTSAAPTRGDCSCSPRLGGAPFIPAGPLFPTVPAEAVRAAFANAPGDEFGSGKMASPQSSAALAANAFGFFLHRPADFPRPPTLPAEVGWPPTRVGLEECARFLWRGGRPTWLDALVETPSHLVGVESKRYEPFQAKSPPAFSAAFWRGVWGAGMRPFEAERDRLRDDPARYAHLDAAQLVKHAFGLRTLASQVRAFATAVAGAEMGFAACAYAAFLAAMGGSPCGDVRQHALDLVAVYRL